MSKKLPPVHPGEVLREDFMAPTGTSINKLALDLHVTPNRILEIAKGKRAITADTALRLAQYLGTTPVSGSASRCNAIWSVPRTNLRKRFCGRCAGAPRDNIGRIRTRLLFEPRARPIATGSQFRKCAVPVISLLPTAHDLSFYNRRVSRGERV